jgi:flagellar motor switch protein FliG
LIHIEDRGIQELVKVVPAGVWKVALRGAPTGVSDLIFRNMSARAAKMLKEDMLAMAKVKVSDVESARAQILGVAQRLEREGKLSLERNKALYI